MIKMVFLLGFVCMAVAGMFPSVSFAGSSDSSLFLAIDWIKSDNPRQLPVTSIPDVAYKNSSGIGYKNGYTVFRISAIEQDGETESYAVEGWDIEIDPTGGTIMTIMNNFVSGGFAWKQPKGSYKKVTATFTVFLTSEPKPNTPRNPRQVSNILEIPFSLVNRP
jgi:hypothetical protein